ncbi:ExbD/TolR family protein [Parasulfitobacter algicola]|uniref:Biopolymer transporter ExbD n=1 Tax=Parasulfitobacter algicola TaxID=2614809 RepID=A0ABX2IVC0_9RHOB|nr:biopolymer transporter ExbD [Sulfitobacter algicola]NSX54787.1 biopolymer transporter ExbD [Sulfitobacter algicola]
MTGLSFGQKRGRRHPSLTPMIDVVFLLLVFFMLAARFGHDGSLALSSGGSAADYSGPPRLIQIGSDDLTLNGFAIDLDQLPEKLSELMETSTDIVVLRSDDDVNIQRLVDVISTLENAGIHQIAVVE